MAITVALAGDTMLGRKVAERIGRAGPRSLVAAEVRDVVAGADLFLVNLECCISDRGSRWPAPGKPFHFRAPPAAVETLRWLGVTDVTLANNHALDYGTDALTDTRRLLTGAGIRVIGAGDDHAQARAATSIEVAGLRIALVGLTDHPPDFAATQNRPGVAYADLRAGVPPGLRRQVRDLRAAHDIVLVTPHWGPNMTTEPEPYVVDAAQVLLGDGATVVAGHSAHVFHGVADRILFDLGDFVDDYLVDGRLRNDLGMLWLLTLDRSGPMRLRAIPLALDYCFTRLADRAEYAWIAARFARACAAFGHEVHDFGDELVVSWV
ncbi:MAG TPA: CapA family protein [Actinopolymorphaceae bacterium]